MKDDDESVPLEVCTMPGTIALTPAALHLAKRFQAAMPSGWIVAFGWYDGARHRESKDAPWEDLGPGIDLGAYKSGQIPKEAIYQTDSLDYVVVIRREVVERHPEKTIDVDASGKIVFR